MAKLKFTFFHHEGQNFADSQVMGEQGVEFTISEWPTRIRGVQMIGVQSVWEYLYDRQGNLLGGVPSTTDIMALPDVVNKDMTAKGAYLCEVEITTN